MSDALEQRLSKGANDRLFVVIDHVLKELVYEFDFEVGQVEAGVVVAVELVSDVENDLVFFVFVFGLHEFVDEATGQVLNLSMAGDERIEFEAHLVADVQIGYLFVLLGDENALKTNDV